MAEFPNGLAPIVNNLVTECISGKREYSDEHDLQHSREDWCRIIEEHLQHAWDAVDDDATYEHELTVVGALVLSALRAERKKRQQDRVVTSDTASG